MDKKLFLQAIIKFFCGVCLTGLLVFFPAGTIAYPNGWLFMSLLFVPMFIAGLVMLFKSPQLLRSRLRAKETEADQKKVVGLSGIMFILGFVLCGLDHRFDWSSLPVGIVIAASIMFLASYIMYAEVLRENAYLSRVIEVQEGQKVIDTGLYGVVRHPMYSSTIVLFLTMPLILGSLAALPIFMLYPLIIAKRIKNEESVLLRELEGYSDYTKKVKYRLIPLVW